MKQKLIYILTILFLSSPALVSAQEPIIYPNDNQTAEQQEKDEFECYKWAKSQSGHDPVNPQASAPPPPAKKKDRTVLRSALRGAAIGGATGGIIGGSDDAATGAAVGATASGMSAAFSKKDAERHQAEAAQQQQGQISQRTSAYDRAFDACMSGRGYTVK